MKFNLKLKTEAFSGDVEVVMLTRRCAEKSYYHQSQVDPVWCRSIVVRASHLRVKLTEVELCYTFGARRPAFMEASEMERLKYKMEIFWEFSHCYNVKTRKSASDLVREAVRQAVLEIPERVKHLWPEVDREGYRNAAIKLREEALALQAKAEELQQEATQLEAA